VLAQETRALQSIDKSPPAIPGSPQVTTHRVTPFEHILPADEPPLPVIADASEVVQESLERQVERVREVIPDVLPTHVFDLLSIHEAAFSNNLLDIVIHILLEDRSYPKDLKGKAKAAEEEDTAEFLRGIYMNVDYTVLDTNRHLGSVYRTLSLVRLDLAFLRTLLTFRIAIPLQ
jgi:TRIAD3 protein (E3 ubiquitin-protein ligase RNF216)